MGDFFHYNIGSVREVTMCVLQVLLIAVYSELTVVPGTSWALNKYLLNKWLFVCWKMGDNRRPNNSVYKTESLLINFLRSILNGGISSKVYLIFAISQKCLKDFFSKRTYGQKVLWLFSCPKVRPTRRWAWLSVPWDSVPGALWWSLWPPSQNVFKSMK